MSLVELGQYVDAAQAQVIRARLEAADILAFCFDSGMNAAYSQPLLVPVRVMVLAEQLAEAQAILAEEAPSSESDRDGEDYQTGRRTRRLALALILAFLLPNLLLAAFIAFAADRPSVDPVEVELE